MEACDRCGIGCNYNPACVESMGEDRNIYLPSRLLLAYAEIFATTSVENVEIIAVSRVTRDELVESFGLVVKDSSGTKHLVSCEDGINLSMNVRFLKKS